MLGNYIIFLLIPVSIKSCASIFCNKLFRFECIYLEFRHSSAYNIFNETSEHARKNVFGKSLKRSLHRDLKILIWIRGYEDRRKWPSSIRCIRKFPYIYVYRIHIRRILHTPTVYRTALVTRNTLRTSQTCSVCLDRHVVCFSNVKNESRQCLNVQRFQEVLES